MKTKPKIKTARILAGILLISSLLANPLVVRVGQDATGQLSAMQQFMERARAVAAQVSPDGAGTPMLLANTFHGTNSSASASVAIILIV